MPVAFFVTRQCHAELVSAPHTLSSRHADDLSYGIPIRQMADEMTE